eukprot:5525917-Amphidinium_carterae.1
MALEQEASQVTSLRHAPEQLRVSIQAKEVLVPSRPASFYRLLAPGVHPKLWGMDPHTSAALAEKS